MKLLTELSATELSVLWNQRRLSIVAVDWPLVLSRVGWNTVPPCPLPLPLPPAPSCPGQPADVPNDRVGRAVVLTGGRLLRWLASAGAGRHRDRLLLVHAVSGGGGDTANTWRPAHSRTATLSGVQPDSRSRPAHDTRVVGGARRRALGRVHHTPAPALASGDSPRYWSLCDSNRRRRSTL